MRYLILVFYFIHFIAHAQESHFSFKENLGQWESIIDYKVERPDHTIFIEKQATWTFVLADQEEYNHFHDTKHLSEDESEYIMNYFAYKIHFVGGDFSQKTTGEKSTSYSNFFIGNNSEKHKSNVHSYQSISYKNVWPQIDLIIYTNEKNQFKYDFILKKGANPSDIQLKYEGPECLTLDNEELVINGSFSLLKEQLPVTYYQESKQQIHCKYQLKNNIISFDLGFDEITETVVIDPVLVAASASGSTGNNFGHTAGYDKDGNIYTGGISFVTGYPTNSGSYQQNYPNAICTAINKLNPTGTSLFYSTYLGGTTGSGYPVSLACTENNKLVVLGTTVATDYPTTSTAFQSSNGGGYDITVSIFSENGSNLLGSTYVGGTNPDGRVQLSNPMNFTIHDMLKGTVNVSNNEIICVATISSNDIVGLDYTGSFTQGPNNSDALVFKMDSTLSTLLGHKIVGGSKHERGYGLTVDQDENIYICGATLSNNLTTTSGVYQENNLADSTRCAGFITKLSPYLNTIQLSTYLSTPPPSTTLPKGNGDYFIDLDNQGNVYTYGLDKDHSIPQIGNGYSFGDGYIYISKFSPDLTTLMATHRMANGFNGELGAFKVDNCNRILFSNYANSSFSTTPDYIFASGGMYVGALSADGLTLEFGTFYTGGHVDGGTSQFSEEGNIYHAVCVNGNTFHCLPDAYSQNIMSAYDCKVFKIDPELEPVEIELTNVWPNMQFCPGMTHEFGTSTTGVFSTIKWYFDGIEIGVNNTEQEITFDAPGVHVIRVEGESECIQFSEDSVVVEVFELEPEFVSDTIHCINQNLQFTDQSIIPPNYLTQISDWYWEFGDGSTSTLQNPTHSYSDVGLYDINLTINTPDSCEFTIEKALHVEIFDVEVDFNSDSIVCLNNEVYFSPNVLIPDHINIPIESYYWEFGDGNSSDEENPVHIYENLGEYDVTLHVTLDNGCTYSAAQISAVSVVLLTIEMTLLTDSIWFPFDMPIEAYTSMEGYDSIHWYVDGESFSSEENIEFYAETDLSEDYVTVELTGWYGNCEATDIKQVKLTNYEWIDIPNAFTPNGDGINDLFFPIGRQVENADYFMFKIHNRWGEQVFYTNDKSAGWDGLNKRGEKSKADVYVWHIDLHSPLSGHQSYNGWVKLIK